MQRCGLRTAMISPFGQRHSAHWFYAGFNEIHNTGMGGMESAENIQPTVDRWLSENAAKDNWYLHVNYWDPHTPYRAPADYGDPFASSPLPEWLDNEELITRHNRMTGPHTSLDIAMYDDAESAKYPRQPGKIVDRASMRRQIDGYDTGIRYFDDHLARIVQQLKDAGVWDETAVIVTADHGENQGELGIYGEHGTADVATCRVPMIIRWPGMRSGAVDSELRYNLDLAPTLMDLLGGEPSPVWDGASFAGSLASGSAPVRDEVVLSQCAHVCQRSVKWDRWLYVRTYHDGFHLFPDEMLYDIVADPYEQNDLAESEPTVCREGAWRLARWHDAQMQKMAADATDAVDPLWTVIREGGPMHAQHAGPGSPLPRYIKRLDETGRSDGAEALRQKYARYLSPASAGDG
jgi:arylsulfatase A-like enzyme